MRCGEAATATLVLTVKPEGERSTTSAPAGTLRNTTHASATMEMRDAAAIVFTSQNLCGQRPDVRRLRARPVLADHLRRHGSAETAAGLQVQPLGVRIEEPGRICVPGPCRIDDLHAFDRLDDAVSYTHLRAHETPEHLVCRLLL